ncbi:MAG: hypothetical protein U1E51_16875 [Candidatus Binatia bacterium]|nr:hypothetical protein [Candidatus Binatia bacterium]
MKEQRRRHAWATDHRAKVLEAVATNPGIATHDEIVRDCLDEDFDRNKILKMVLQLRKEGLIGRADSVAGHFITRAGLEYLTGGQFDRGLPCPHERPNGRGKRK